MHEEALSWAESVLGSAVVAAAAIPGGTTSTMLALTDATGRRSVLRLVDTEPWRTHGAELTRRERAAQQALSATPVPTPRSIAVDPEGTRTGVAAHLMSHLPGAPTTSPDDATITAMVEMLARIHRVRSVEPLRTYQSWAWEAKWVVPPWTGHPASWRRAFEVLAADPPAYAPTFLHRDFSHRNLLWLDGTVSGVVDWVETSTGPAWLDAGHAATNLAVAYGLGPAAAFLEGYAALAPEPPDAYWLVMDVVGFLPPPGRRPPFAEPAELRRLDAWLHHLVGCAR